MRYLSGSIIFLFIVFTTAIYSTPATAGWEAKVDRVVLNQTAAGAQAEFLIVLPEQGNLAVPAAYQTKAQKGRYVYETLTSLARRTQQPLLSYLKAQGIAHQPYWVANMVWAKGDAAAVQAIARRTDVATIEANVWVRFAAQPLGTPGNKGAAEPGRQEEVLQAPEWNLEQINAPDAWAAGITGQGAVIGGQDTGFDWTHPGLRNQYRGWNGTSASHDYNWHDAISANHPNTPSGNSCGFDVAEPCDDLNHGTHTMGTMVGDDGNGNQTGVAPGAKWIACRNMEEGWGSPATYSECFEWFIASYPFGGDPFSDGDPDRAPHVINNSWSCPASEGCTMPDVLRQVVEAVRAAGIVTVQSAGNNGPNCSTVTTPAAIYEASFTVGATTLSDQITGFSSRGPVAADGSGRLKPNITAPGESIRSTIPGGFYGTLSGTSMAAPHIAGVVALLIAAEPLLGGDVDELESLIEQTAVPLTTDQGCGTDSPTTVPNNVYGWGRVDALAAVEAIASPPPPTCYLLTLAHAGLGGDPIASPTHSPGCDHHAYHAGTVIELTAMPGDGWYLLSWFGTNNDELISIVNDVTMPDHNHSVSVIYASIPADDIFLPVVYGEDQP